MKVNQGNGDQRPLPPGWRWARLGDLCRQDRRIITGLSQAAARLPYLGLENIEADSGRILSVGAATGLEEGISTTFFFSPNHVLYGKLRPYLNKVALPEFEGRCTTEIVPLLPNDGVDRPFLGWMLRRREIVAEAMFGKTGSRMPRASLSELFSLTVSVPPFFEQKRIAAILNERMAAIDKARAAAEAQLEATKALQFALVRASVAGNDV
ncbi:MAG TPA: restriction endonuclease subunit S [Candidatus Aminicenantes bacterium]|nr:restriction endonuclease subunit S [Candidatus Aminicenantes bacterium]